MTGGIGSAFTRQTSVHGPDVTGAVLIGSWWTTLAFLGIAGFSIAVAVGASGSLGVFVTS